MSRQVAQFLWVGTELSDFENLCLWSFLKAGYAVDLYTYNTLKNVPRGVEYRDAGEIVPEKEVFLGPGVGKGSYANFSDKFRYYLLFKKGGWWFDTDHIAVQVRPEPTDLLVASQWETNFGEHGTGSAMWSKPGDPRMGWMAEQCDRILEAGGEREYTRTGPILVHEMVEEFSAWPNMAPWWEFNPYPYWYVDRVAYKTGKDWLVDKARYARHRLRELTDKNFRAGYVRPGTRAVHLFNEIWRSKNMDKNALYHPGSLYGGIQREHRKAQA